MKVKAAERRAMLYRVITYLTHKGRLGTMTKPVGAGPSRLWSLWDLMNTFRAHELVATTKSVLYWADLADYMRSQQRGSQPFNEDSYKLMLESVVKTQQLCGQAGFISAFQRIGLIHQRLDLDRSRNDSSYLAAELVNVWDAILEALVNHRFLRVSAARAVCVDNYNLFGPTVVATFPAAKADIIEAGNCLAAECNTAAVFHAMRVVEWGLRAFCVHLGFHRLRVVKKSGKIKFIPVDYLEWEKILDGLQLRVDQRIEKMRPGPKKQSTQEFYYPALQDIRGVRDAWRNHTMHNRREFSSADADAIFSHVIRLMTALAERFGKKA